MTAIDLCSQNYIKRQAKEHDGFRRFAVARAQQLHRIDMRMRLGILHDAAAQERMHEREQRAAEEKKRKAETPTVRTEAEQKKFEEEQARVEQEGSAKKYDGSSKPARIKIRPLSETRAIDLGANFFSEAFIFGVAAGLLIWDSWRSRKKETARRDDVAERLERLEAEVELLWKTRNPNAEELRDLENRIRATKEVKASSWWNPASWVRTSTDAAQLEESKDHQEQSPSGGSMQTVKKIAIEANASSKAAETAVHSFGPGTAKPEALAGSK